MSAPSYLQLATALTHAEVEEPTLARVAQKSIALRLIRNHAREACCCSAYLFPHRSGSGWCPGTNGDDFTDDRTKIDAEELACFDRAAARAINNGFN